MSKAEFFAEHGFVLLDSKTKVTKWNTDYMLDFKWMGIQVFYVLIAVVALITNKGV